MSKVSNNGVNAFDDQIRANMGLNGMELKHNHVQLYDNETWTGTSENGAFTATILHFNVVCRWTCKQEDKPLYYVWHNKHKLSSKGLGNNEMGALKSDGTWLLSENWELVAKNSTAQRLDWLREMKNHT